VAVQVETIPLLALPAVLFPGTFLPIDLHHISHPELVAECLEEGKELGVILTAFEPGSATPAVPYTVGCFATVAFLLYQNETPTSAVLYGDRRLRLLEMVPDTPMPVGRIEVLDEFEGPHAKQRSRQASQLFQRYLGLIRQRYQADVTSVPLPDDPTAASYLLASALYLPLDTKQRWLETASATLRLEAELAYLTDECDRLTTFLALAHSGRHHYTLPDPNLYLSKISLN
jgi:ATP-dependent Lon protease